VDVADLGLNGETAFAGAPLTFGDHVRTAVHGVNLERGSAASSLSGTSCVPEQTSSTFAPRARCRPMAAAKILLQREQLPSEATALP